MLLIYGGRVRKLRIEIMNNKTMISSNEITERYNISYQTVNYYTNLGLLVVKKRKNNGRLYDRKDVKKRLSRIRLLKNKGYPLSIIGKVLHKKKKVIL